ncbi:LysR family transcriptional regulator substrate-binding protein [Streptomyces sp. TS71-3]|uniref:LysR family transcriptional regulator substrate-binding protein n=1 Tax=Streptomyces sp. TS71-3 TaxID=2733862 RepID=UPI001B120961|nr:LysR family transcriptional regulator substrate-binding protein [Streptomyces sp. TS71-3]GHJ39405.1 hypothetical protein Sm713_50140 [Streptomyces sp. TS71-3]
MADRAVLEPCRQSEERDRHVRAGTAGVRGALRARPVGRHGTAAADQLRQSSAGSAGNLQAVLDGSLDLALTVGGRRPPDGIVLRPLVDEPLAFLCRADHPLAGRSLITLADLSGTPILRFPPGWGTRDTVDRVLGPVDSATEIAGYTLMVKLIRAGFGATLMPASAVAGAAGVCVIPLDAPELTWHLSAAVSTRRRPTAATEALLGALITAADDVTGPRNA